MQAAHRVVHAGRRRRFSTQRVQNHLARTVAIAMRRGRSRARDLAQRGCALLLAISLAACGTSPTRVGSPGNPPMTAERPAETGEKAIERQQRGDRDAGPADASPSVVGEEAFYRIPQNAKVALAAQPYVEPSIDAPATLPSAGEGLKNAGKVAGGTALGALGGAVYGLKCGIFFFICSPILAAGGAVFGAVGTAAKIEREGPSGVPNPTADALWALGENRSKTQASDEPNPAGTTLGERIYRLGRANGLAELTLLSDSTQSTTTDEAPYAGKADYVFEVGLSRLVQAFEGENGQWKLQIDAVGRLVRADGHVAVARFETRAMSRQTFETGESDEALLNAAFDDVMQGVAATFLNEWIAPMMKDRSIATEPRAIR